MNTIDIAALLNLLGFTSGAVLYAMLLALVMRHAPHAFNRAATAIPTVNRLLFTTSLLGLLWNVGSLITAALGNFGINRQLSLLSVVSFTALGFLPAVVVHSALQTRDGRIGVAARSLKFASYGLSTVAGCLHFYVSFTVSASFSDLALRTLTIGYLVLVLMLFLLTKQQTGHKRRAIWASALAVFAVSALHLSHHTSTAAESWLVELIGHHASLPLALAILYQDYRFAFADLFLKRALALLLLVALAFALYVNIAAPLLSIRGTSGQLDPRAVVTLLCLWVGTALLYPLLRRASLWFVDAVVLRRANYTDLRHQLSQQIADRESVEEVLGTVCALLKPALTASHVRWMSADEYVRANNAGLQGIEGFSAEQTSASRNQPVVLLERTTEDSATVFVSTAERPYFVIVIGRLAWGRRLLSDDVLLLEAAAIAAARRIDVLRVVHERCEQGLREQEISKLATEAQLRALRAQLNPHFLFNALTTIGYLITASPERALRTLLKLTELLRRVLKVTGEFVTLGEELKVVESYLDIERERFEERLHVVINVPPELLEIRVPPLIVQPLVENAIKHGIAPSRMGGTVEVVARLRSEPGQLAAATLIITVRNTGVGVSESELIRGRRRGVGLNNIEERLRHTCGLAASLEITSAPESGATVHISVPVSLSGQSRINVEELFARMGA